MHCVPWQTVTPTLFGFQNKRKSSKGNVHFPIWALSHGINSHTQYAMLQQNPSSKLNSKSKLSPLAPWTKLLNFFISSANSPPSTLPTFPVDLPVSVLTWCTHVSLCVYVLCACIFFFVCVCVCLCVCVCVCVNCYEVSECVFLLFLL